MLGMHGTVYANYAVNEADLLLAFGVRFDDRVTGKLSEFAKHGKIVHIDIDPSRDQQEQVRPHPGPRRRARRSCKAINPAGRRRATVARLACSRSTSWRASRAADATPSATT